MNYRHAFHAGNHADVLKHVALLTLLDVLKRKDGPFFVLDTHAGRGRYELAAEASRRTAEAATGIGRLRAGSALPEVLQRYLEAVACHGDGIYPGSPLLVAGALREQDRLAACELQPEEAQALKALFARDPRVAVHERDGYAAIRALLPPRAGTTRFARGLVLIDPPYEAQDAEYPQVLAALKEGLQRWPNATWAVWYPVKRRRSLLPFFRSAAALPAKSALVAELLVRADDSPLRLNGSGMLLLNPPWQFDKAIAPALPALRQLLGEHGASTRLEWLREAD
ncbi:MAG: 23S rRNA (adenine(2030)-N(6))-methyltransferase RlmJ [Pseudoxanthomonas sp.]